jgi:hypothetical protein
MQQQAVIPFFTLKGLKARATHTELKLVYGLEALDLPAVEECQRRFHQGRTNLFDDCTSEWPLANDFGKATSSMLAERPFSSWKMLYRHFRIGKTTWLRVFHDELGFKELHFRWTPHALSINHKSERVSYSRILLTTLMEQRAGGFQQID